MKTCTLCLVEKPLSEFYLKNKYSKRVPHARCKPCYNAKQAEWAANRVQVYVIEKECGRCHEVKPAAAFARSRRAKTGLQSYCYACAHLHEKHRRCGLKPGQLEAAQDEAAGRCPACQKERPLVIDHDHKTGLFRGLLCTPCNLVLGHTADDPAVLRALADYLER